jgi:hypothetical protein
MYTDIDFKTKKDFKSYFLTGRDITVYQPGGMFEGKTDGDITIEGPHYPRPHTWYSRARIENGIVRKILS